MLNLVGRNADVGARLLVLRDAAVRGMRGESIHPPPGPSITRLAIPCGAALLHAFAVARPCRWNPFDLAPSRT